ncbi:methylated-DNA--[protein]-cysteine S-methyltransferase [Inediibacterium massiliense]|uniref:methylated-DNA--[protein]-cysteine S-methyltransferase n=1 Tax=Inediibacterium massiliense TaxID=1658111 RepID=UPI0006B471F6|nr:methylated-DNA--[protein]-cysteine S-methyltransferase [Inediibacterium massiliense]
MKRYIKYYDSPIGIIEIIGTEEYILSVHFVEEKKESKEGIEIVENAYMQLDEYFNGVRKDFHINFYLEGTDFQKRVWNELLEIPYGKTISYQELAKNIGNEKAVRAVGGANHKNNISIMIPCHRVIGKDGKLTGYGGGLWRKKWLIEHEKRF